MGIGRVTAERARTIAVFVIAAIVVAAVIGSVMPLLGSQVPQGAVAAQPPRGNRINDDVETSFGIVAVEFIRQLDGVTNRALSGSTHGVNGLVDAEHAKIQVAVAITNQAESPLRYTSDQFRLRVIRDGKTTRQAVTGGDLPDTRILPHAGITGHIDFTVPRTNADLAIEFDDPGRTAPIVIQLGKAAFEARAPGGHNH